LQALKLFQRLILLHFYILDKIYNFYTRITTKLNLFYLYKLAMPAIY
jgi:hypothetical protein